MNILTNSNEKIKRNKKDTLNMLSNSNIIKPKVYKNKDGIPVMNGINNENENIPKVNFFEKPKIYDVKFYYLYNQNFSKEEEEILKSFDYFTRKSKNKIKRGIMPIFHIILGKEYLKKSTQALSIIPNEQIILNKSNLGEDKFMNVCMIHVGYSAGANECPKNEIVQFNEFPVFHLEFNTNKSIKYCNDDSVKELIKLITENSVYINKNNSLSASGNLLGEKNVNYSGVQNEENNKNGKIIFETPSLVLKFINNRYYQLFQKNAENTLFIKKELLNKLFQNRGLYLKIDLFEKLKELNKNFIINDSNILNVNIEILNKNNNNQIKVTQNSMVKEGANFLEFYKNQQSEYNLKGNILLKKYLIALHYMKMKGNGLFEINSNIIKNMKEFQNSYYLGFDLEYMIINHLKKYGKNKSLLIPFVAKLENKKYILYYLYIINNDVYLYEILNNDERNRSLTESDSKLIVNKINNKIESYFKRIFSISFLSKAPLKYHFKGLVRKNVDFKIHFIDENKIQSIYNHLHLFYKILNPKMELKEIYKNKGTDEMLKFITLLLEL